MVSYEDIAPRDPELPTGNTLAWPTLQAVMELGGSATNQEIQEAVIKREGFSDELQQLMRPDGVTTELITGLLPPGPTCEPPAPSSAAGEAFGPLLSTAVACQSGTCRA